MIAKRERLWVYRKSCFAFGPQIIFQKSEAFIVDLQLDLIFNQVCIKRAIHEVILSCHQGDRLLMEYLKLYGVLVFL